MPTRAKTKLAAATRLAGRRTHRGFRGRDGGVRVENYRDTRNRVAEMHQAAAGIIAELTSGEIKSHRYSDAILADIPRRKRPTALASGLCRAIIEFLEHHIRQHRRGTARSRLE
jgi:hypothetical protein